jgi:hypothetical protein
LVDRRDLALVILAVGSVAVLAVAPIATRARPAPPSPPAPTQPPTTPPAPPAPPTPPPAPPVTPPPIEELTFRDEILRSFAEQGGVAVVFITMEPYEEQIQYARDALRSIQEYTGRRCAFPAIGMWPEPVFRKRDMVQVGNAFVVFATLSQYYKDWAGYCRQLIRSALESAFYRTYDYIIEF